MILHPNSRLCSSCWGYGVPKVALVEYKGDNLRELILQKGFAYFKIGVVYVAECAG